LPGALKKPQLPLRGELWIDRETFQIWREDQPAHRAAARAMSRRETVFDYAPSDFGNTCAEGNNIIENSVRKILKTENSAWWKTGESVFDYSKFRKTNVEVQILDEP
jgi:hypothetical protein